MQSYQNSLLRVGGYPLSGASILVKTSSGATASIFSDNLGTPAANPLTSDALGNFQFWAADGVYSLVISSPGLVTQTITGVHLEDQLSIDTGTSTEASPLTGSEFITMSRGSGLLQTSLTNVGAWISSTYTAFTHIIAGSIARTFRSKLSDFYNAADAGANTGATDNSSAFATAVAGGGVPVQINTGTFNFTNFFQSLTLPVRLRGASMFGTTLQLNSTASLSIISNTGVNGASIKDLSLSTPSANNTSTGQVISLIDANDATVENVAITGLTGTGTGVIVYNNVNTTVNNIRLKDLKIIGNLANAVNNNGTLIVNGLFCQQRGIYADSINEFAVEYKNATAYCTLSDAIVNNSLSAIEYGQTAAPGVSYSAAANLIAKDCAAGFEMGQAQYNVATNMVVSIQTPFSAVKEGVRFAASSNFNSFSNFLFTGSFNNPVHHFSNFNYISAAFHNVGNAITLELGSAGNVTAVNHPGARTSIYSGAITDLSGQTLSGSNSNPIYCHATGEYLGTLSDMWRWVNTKSGNAIRQNSGHKWIFEGTGSVFTNILTDGTGTPGYSVSKSGETHSVLYNWSSSFWQIDAGASPTSYRFSAASLNTSADNVASLGNAVFRFSNVYSILGTFAGNLSVTAVGSGLLVKEGANAKQGVATLSSGTIVVSNTSVTASSRIQLTAQDNNSTGALRVSARTAGTSFTITSSNAADSGVVAYEIFEPA